MSSGDKCREEEQKKVKKLKVTVTVECPFL